MKRASTETAKAAEAADAERNKRVRFAADAGSLQELLERAESAKSEQGAKSAKSANDVAEAKGQEGVQVQACPLEGGTFVVATPKLTTKAPKTIRGCKYFVLGRKALCTLVKYLRGKRVEGTLLIYHGAENGEARLRLNVTDDIISSDLVLEYDESLPSKCPQDTVVVGSPDVKHRRAVWDAFFLSIGQGIYYVSKFQKKDWNFEEFPFLCLYEVKNAPCQNYSQWLEAFFSCKFGDPVQPTTTTLKWDPEVRVLFWHNCEKTSSMKELCLSGPAAFLTDEKVEGAPLELSEKDKETLETLLKCYKKVDDTEDLDAENLEKFAARVVLRRQLDIAQPIFNGLAPEREMKRVMTHR